MFFVNKKKTTIFRDHKVVALDGFDRVNECQIVPYLPDDEPDFVLTGFDRVNEYQTVPYLPDEPDLEPDLGPGIIIKKLHGIR